MKFNSDSVRKLIIAHLFLVSVFLFFWSMLGLPWELIYIFDLFVAVEFLWVMRSVQRVMRRVKLYQMIPYLILFILYLFLTQLFSFTSLGLAVMAYRRIFRFVLFYFACAVLLEKKSIDKIIRLMLMLQAVNFVLTLYQYFFQGLSQDYLGGIFGIERGANAYSNTFLCIICTYMIVAYLDKRVRFWPMMLTLGSSLLISALAELKVFFVEIVVIVLAAVLMSRPSIRTIKIILFGAAGFVGAMAVLAKLFPEHMAILLSWALFSEYTTEAIHGYNISRLNAFSDINRIFFEGDVIRNLFGYGFGNCETGSAFYDVYEKYHYTWFSHQVTFLETGYVGVILYGIFYVLVYLHAAKSRKINPENKHYYTLTQISCIISPMWFVYNQSMRVESAYYIFFVMAIPVAIRNDWIKRQSKGIP